MNRDLHFSILCIRMLGVLLFALVGIALGEEVCYPRIGCFNDDAPWDGLPLPEDPRDIPTVFRLYTRAKKGDDDYEIISADKPGSFDPTKKTFFYLHGWNSSPENEGLSLKTLLLEKYDMNVILVDWEEGAADLIFVNAASNTRVVGAEIALLISVFQERLRFDPSLVHMSGLSIGSQAAAQAGKRFNMEDPAVKIGRITGMDPAGPVFDVEPEFAPKMRLYPGDAQFVDVIHTNGWDWIELGIGQKSGDVDFYVNGGGDQPGCDGIPGCSHTRSFSLFYESIRSNCTFKAVPCATRDDLEAGKCKSCDPATDCQYMGIKATDNPDRKGNYYLTTLDKPPYCKD